jgi:transposase-like protein
MNTKLVKPAARRTRRRHTPEFKVQVIEACLQPGVSVAGVALANGLNANYLRRWVREHREQTVGTEIEGSVPASSTTPMALVPVSVASPVVAEASEIRIDIRRGQTTVQMAWPAVRAESLGQWLKELLE